MNKKWEKRIRQLHTKKFRRMHQQFLAEGSKAVAEALHYPERLEALFYTPKFAETYAHALKELRCSHLEVEADALQKLGSLQTNDGALAIVRIPAPHLWASPPPFTLVLDQVRDPGNVGTILRLADWFSIDRVICSENCVDTYNPKVVAASMGSIFRVDVQTVSLETFFAELPAGVQIAGACMDGRDFVEVNPQPPFVLVMGSESHGISAEVDAQLTERITIPGYSAAESLNVAMASSILCAHFRRKIPLS